MFYDIVELHSLTAFIERRDNTRKDLTKFKALIFLDTAKLHGMEPDSKDASVTSYILKN